MKIPNKTNKPRFYVAFSIEEAHSSWGSLLEAQACISRLGAGDPFLHQIKGIVENSTLGPRFVFLARHPVNEHDHWVETEGEQPVLRSELVKMCRRQLETRDRWISEMPHLPKTQQEWRRELLQANAKQFVLAEDMLTAYGALFPNF